MISKISKNKTCVIDGCDNKIRSGKCQWCEKHYYRNRRNGDQEKLFTRQYRVNEKIFDEWNDSTAWMIGLLWTDGYMSGGDTVGIKLKDEQLIKEIHREIDTDVEIKTRINKKTGGEYKSVSIANRYLADRLRSIGMHRPKTHTIEYPKGMPDELFGSFLRGVIDGDGTVSLNKRRKGQQVKDCRLSFVTASKKFGLQMLNAFRTRGIKATIAIRGQYLKSGKVCKQWKGTDLWKIQICNLKDIRKLYEIMYPDDKVPCLHRKRDLIKEFYQTPRARSGNPNKYIGFWDDEEKLIRLKEMFINPNISKEEMVKFFNRTWMSIRTTACKKLGLVSPCYWTKDEDQVIYQHYERSNWPLILFLLPNRNKNACALRGRKLGITRSRYLRSEKTGACE